MKTIKKSIFAALILAVMGIFITRIASDVTVSELLDQNIEALAGIDPSKPPKGYIEGYLTQPYQTSWGTIMCCLPDTIDNACNPSSANSLCPGIGGGVV